MLLLIRKLLQYKSSLKLKEQRNYITELLLDIEINRESPEPLKTYSYPDFRWLRGEIPKELWSEWVTEGQIGQYHISMIHQKRNTKVEVSNEETIVLSYISDKAQSRHFNFDNQFLITNEEDIEPLLQELYKLLTPKETPKLITP
ncbi:hypothetical protein QTV49_000497 [Vibrio vulnificus]|nr:hypothetical protein [Vibrio vulnificus]